MGKHVAIRGRTPQEAFLKLMGAFERADIETAVELLIERLDNSDDHEDVPNFLAVSDGLPGDPSDAEPDDDDKGDVSWSEWQTRGTHKLGGTGTVRCEPVMRSDGNGIAHEDDEDDDPAEHDDDDGCAAGDDNLTNWGAYGFFGGRFTDGTLAGESSYDNEDSEENGDERDGNGSEDDFMIHGWDGPGCPIADPGEHDGREKQDGV